MDLNEISSILNFYQSRSQQGAGMNYFYTPYSMQRGSGIGSYLSGVFRPLIPITSKASSHVKTALSNIGDDLSENPSFSNLKTSLKRRGAAGLKSIAEELCSTMKGGGGGRRRRKKTVKKKTATSRKTIKRRVVKKKAPVKRKPSTRKKPVGIEYPLFK